MSRWTWPTRIYVTCVAARGALVVALLVAAQGRDQGGPPDDDLWFTILVTALGLAFIVELVTALVWIQRAWQRLPYDARVTASGRRVQPGSAVARLFIPLYNLYWMFVVSLGLCEAVDTLLLGKGVSARSPRGLAIAACVACLVPNCGLWLAPILWAVFAAKMEGPMAELERSNLADAAAFD